ncbi:MAG: glycosyltransferase [Cytophagales bacterium]|nr:glycosyltransferase [Cytophagales bacterium]
MGIRFKVLFLSKWYPNKNRHLSGIFVREHAKAAANYCDVSLLHITSDPNLKNTSYCIEAFEDDNLYTVIVYYKSYNFQFSILKKALNSIRYFRSTLIGLRVIKKDFGKPDLIHVNVLTRPAIIAFILKTFKGIPYIITEHWTGYASSHFSRKNIFHKIITRFVVRKAKAVTTVSQSLKENMLHYGLLNKYYIVPNVVELSRNDGRNGYSQDKKIILNVSDLEDYKKNVSGIIKAVYEIIKIRADIELHIIGDGKDRDALENLAKELDLLNTHVFFQGEQLRNDVYHFMNKIDFLITNSNYETFSIATAEAIAHGKPVIVTRSGGPEEFVTNEVGIVIEPGNQKLLQETILYMLDNYKKYNSKILKDYINKKFNHKVIGKQFYNIYKSILTVWKAGNSGEKLEIDPGWKVLDVGSGHNPNRRANVLLDKELGISIHRSGKKVKFVVGKTFVKGNALNMPFDNHQFDFVIASHIAEHVDDPHRFCKELQRVGKRGYIETPGPIDELFFNEPTHKWLVFKKKKWLIFKEKKKFKVLSDYFYRLYYLNENRYGHQKLYSKNLLLVFISIFLRRIWKYLPYTFTKYHWENEIKFKVIPKK